jgi:hypothetical protein
MLSYHEKTQFRSKTRQEILILSYVYPTAMPTGKNQNPKAYRALPYPHSNRRITTTSDLGHWDHCIWRGIDVTGMQVVGCIYFPVQVCIRYT